MISFFVGVPGSGKTYFAVDKIFNNFSNDFSAKRDKNATYENCYTNINEFKFDKLDNVFKLDFDVLKRNLTKLHQYYKDKKDDEFLINKCKEMNIYNTLFVVDEAHNYFDSPDLVLTWWLSYHRHLFHEIILITQNLALIHSKYKSFSEFFYKAFPQSLTLFKTHFKYNVYCQSRMSQNSKSGSIKIKRDKKVFDLYKSGDSINSQNIILKFVLFSVVLFVALIIYFKFFVLPDSKDNDKNITQIQTSSPVPVVVNSIPAQNYSTPVQNYSTSAHDTKYSNKMFIELSCNSSSCYNKDIFLPIPLFEYYIKNKTIKLLYSKKINNNLYKYYVEFSNNFYDYISNKGSKNEAPINGSVSPVTTFNGK